MGLVVNRVCVTVKELNSAQLEAKQDSPLSAEIQ